MLENDIEKLKEKYLNDYSFESAVFYHRCLSVLQKHFKFNDELKNMLDLKLFKEFLPEDEQEQLDENFDKKLKSKGLGFAVQLTTQPHKLYESVNEIFKMNQKDRLKNKNIHHITVVPAGQTNVERFLPLELIYWYSDPIMHLTADLVNNITSNVGVRNASGVADKLIKIHENQTCKYLIKNELFSLTKGINDEKLAQIVNDFIKDADNIDDISEEKVDYFIDNYFFNKEIISKSPTYTASKLFNGGRYKKNFREGHSFDFKHSFDNYLKDFENKKTNKINKELSR